MKGLTTEWDISVLEDFQRIHGLVVAILNAMKSTTITQKRVSTILKLIFNFMVIPASQFESRPLEPKLILQSADYKTLSSILDVSSEIITVVLQMLLFRHSLNSTALFTRETLAAFNIPFSAFKELEKAKFLPTIIIIKSYVSNIVYHKHNRDTKKKWLPTFQKSLIPYLSVLLIQMHDLC